MPRLMESEELDTFLHKGLHPLTKMVCFLLVVVLAGLWMDVRLLLPLFIAGIIFAIWSRTPRSWFGLLVAAILLTWFATVRTMVAQVNPEYFKVLDRAWAGHKILTYNFPIFGTLGLTYGSLFWLAGRLVRFSTVVTWALVFIWTTPMGDIANTLYALKVPQPGVFVFTITYKFIPYMASVIDQISDAQKLRGWNLRTWNLVKLAKRSLPMANPLVRRTAVIVEQVTTAAQIRGFGAGKVTPLIDLKLSLLDRIIIGAFAAGFVVALVLLVRFNVGVI